MNLEAWERPDWKTEHPIAEWSPALVGPPGFQGPTSHAYRLVMENGGTAYGCAYCPYVRENVAGILRKHIHAAHAVSTRAARAAKGSARAYQSEVGSTLSAQLALMQLPLAEVMRLAAVAMESDRWRERALAAEHQLAKCERALQ